MWDEQLEHYGDLFVGCRFGEAGLTFEEFLRHPMKAITSLQDGPKVRQWARGRMLSATKLATSACGVAERGPGSEVQRQAGIAEHARFDNEVRRYMGVVGE